MHVSQILRVPGSQVAFVPSKEAVLFSEVANESVPCREVVLFSEVANGSVPCREIVLFSEVANGCREIALFSEVANGCREIVLFSELYTIRGISFVLSSSLFVTASILPAFCRLHRLYGSCMPSPRLQWVTPFD